MIPQDVLDRIDALPIEEVIAHFGGLELHDNKCLCPFHVEKTPSFTIRPDWNRYKCFGCGKSGGVVDFVMAARGLGWREAVLQLAQWKGLEVQEVDMTPEMVARAEWRQGLFSLLAAVADIAQDALRSCAKGGEQEKAVFDYVVGRWGDPSVADSPAAKWGLGYCPNDLRKRLEAQGYTYEQMVTTGVVKETNDGKGRKAVVPLRGRVLFPIRDQQGRICGFAGRTTRSVGRYNPKFLNTPTTELFKKGELLFGFAEARPAIARAGVVYLVEGYADAMRLHSIGVCNAVARMGTALTAEQVALIAGVAKSVIIIPDSDTAGQESAAQSARRLIGAGVCVSVMGMGDGKEKVDADSLFTTRELFDQYAAEQVTDYILSYAKTHLGKGRLMGAQVLVVEEAARLVKSLPEASWALYEEGLGKIVGGKTYWRKAIRQSKRLSAGGEPAWRDGDVELDEGLKSELKKAKIVNDSIGLVGLRLSERGEATAERISNFRLLPLYFMKDAVSSKRILSLRNALGEEVYIELSGTSKALAGPGDFRQYCLRFGNYSFWGNNADIVAISVMISEGCSEAIEIKRMGWHPDGFFVWSNGCWCDGAFKEFNRFGAIELRGKMYYLAAANENKSELAAYQQMRQFRYRDSGLGAQAYFKQFCDVYGDNGKIGILYLVATLFRDIIFAQTKMFPILNAYGPRGTGKSMMMRSLLAPFFESTITTNLPTSTLATLTAVLERYSNAIMVFDEYTSALKGDKVELLKSLYDGGGRSKSISLDGSDDRYNTTSSVYSGVCLSGQQIPDTEVALFTRVLFVQFLKNSYSDEENARLMQLHAMEEEGVSGVVHEVLRLRAQMEARFNEEFVAACRYLRGKMEGAKVDSRTISVWGVLLATMDVVADDLPLPFTRDEMYNLVANFYKTQVADSDSLDDVRGFWNTFEYLVGTGVLVDGIDFRVRRATGYVAKGDGARYELAEGGQELLYLNTKTVLPAYAKNARDVVSSPLPNSTIRNYLKKSESFISAKALCRFKRRDIRGDVVYSRSTGSLGGEAVETFPVRAMCFDYVTLDISVKSDGVGREEFENDLTGGVDNRSLPPIETAEEELPF